MCSCINHRLPPIPEVLMGYTVVLQRVGLEKKLLKIPLWDYCHHFFTVRQETHLATMSLNHLAQYYLELVIASHYRPWDLKIPRCAGRLLNKSVNECFSITNQPDIGINY